MNNKEAIHLQFPYMGMLNSKRDVLEIQKSSIIISRSMKNYHELKKEEIKKGKLLYKQIKALLLTIKNFQRTSPKFELPESITRRIFPEKSFEPRIKKTGADLEKNVHENSIELQEIQNRLRELQRG